ncbi:hypothetical protein L226DRAFT_567212 [Lentinus tigrinus ALCF2SS1-7]|uniref:Uncharacterized protein n=1 Tax=Lentinus tigrinus ALCF2SS1-6 TaxID=1328759 RepID=A0A5C2SP09_9APHY|nr:hypothetical protein L227DRAFT_607056 [Lentinus tigrinus ALCF2SS1-6]RPD79017.1 hypothetical protein L226DRAFT_567212 [Lentinus tigrinus ALCF2SS1-7]
MKQQFARKRVYDIPRPSNGPDCDAQVEVEAASITATLSSGESRRESPLWRGREIPYDKVTDAAEPILVPSGQTTADVLADTASRISNFVYPEDASFMYPPTTPTAMFPGSGRESRYLWEKCPSALRRDSPGNAAFLLHAAYLRFIVEQPLVTEQLQGQLVIMAESALREMEAWLMSEWFRQQMNTPDPGRLKNYNVTNTGIRD